MAQPACNSVQGATATLAFTATWHCGICNLQNLKNPVGFESHPLRHHKQLRRNDLLNPIF